MNNIINPETNEHYNIFSKQGTNLLKTYIKMFQNGGTFRTRRRQKKTTSDKKRLSVSAHSSAAARPINDADNIVYEPQITQNSLGNKDMIGYTCKHKCSKYTKEGKKHGKQIATDQRITPTSFDGEQYKFQGCTDDFPKKGALKNYQYNVLQYCKDTKNEDVEGDDCDVPLYIKSYDPKRNQIKVADNNGVGACGTTRDDDDFVNVDSNEIKASFVSHLNRRLEVLGKKPVKDTVDESVKSVNIDAIKAAVNAVKKVTSANVESIERIATEAENKYISNYLKSINERAKEAKEAAAVEAKEAAAAEAKEAAAASLRRTLQSKVSGTTAGTSHGSLGSSGSGSESTL
jgi:hypothetical protein